MFKRTQTLTNAHGLVVCWTRTEPYASGQISASRDGVLVHGTFPVTTDPARIEEFKVILDEALRTHQALRAEGRAYLYGDDLYPDCPDMPCPHVDDGRPCVFTAGHRGEHRLRAKEVAGG